MSISTIDKYVGPAKFISLSILYMY